MKCSQHVKDMYWVTVSPPQTEIRVVPRTTQAAKAIKGKNFANYCNVVLPSQAFLNEIQKKRDPSVTDEEAIVSNTKLPAPTTIPEPHTADTGNTDSRLDTVLYKTGVIDGDKPLNQNTHYCVCRPDPDNVSHSYGSNLNQECSGCGKKIDEERVYSEVEPGLGDGRLNMTNMNPCIEVNRQKAVDFRAGSSRDLLSIGNESQVDSDRDLCSEVNKSAIRPPTRPTCNGDVLHTTVNDRVSHQGSQHSDGDGYVNIDDICVSSSQVSMVSFRTNDLNNSRKSLSQIEVVGKRGTIEFNPSLNIDSDGSVENNTKAIKETVTDQGNGQRLNSTVSLKGVALECPVDLDTTLHVDDVYKSHDVEEVNVVEEADNVHQMPTVSIPLSDNNTQHNGGNVGPVESEIHASLVMRTPQRWTMSRNSDTDSIHPPLSVREDIACQTCGCCEAPEQTRYSLHRQAMDIVNEENDHYIMMPHELASVGLSGCIGDDDNHTSSESQVCPPHPKSHHRPGSINSRHEVPTDTEVQGQDAEIVSKEAISVSTQTEREHEFLSNSSIHGHKRHTTVI